MKVLFWDCETAPSLVYTFSYFKTFIGLDQIVEHPRMLGFSYMWQGQKRAKWVSEYHHPEGRRGMLRELHALLDEADVVVGYNSKKYDARYAEGEFLVEGMPPPSPYRHVDLYLEVRAHTLFPSKKLDYASWVILDKRKTDPGGFSTWKGCLNGDPKAWATMKKYGIRDTELLPPLYEALRPYMKNHPNIGITDSIDELVCPACGSENHQRRGHYDTNAGRYQRYQCQDCFKWFRGVARVSTTPGRSI